MRLFNLSFLLLISSTAFAQIEEYQLCLTNKADQIYAIVNQEVLDNLRTGGKEFTEPYHDFVYHSQKLKEKISIPVKIYISSVVTFEKEKIDIKGKSPFTYLFIKKQDKQPLILKGVDSWASLKEQVTKYFNSDKSSTLKEKQRPK